MHRYALTKLILSSLIFSSLTLFSLTFFSLTFSSLIFSSEQALAVAPQPLSSGSFTDSFSDSPSGESQNESTAVAELVEDSQVDPYALQLKVVLENDDAETEFIHVLDDTVNGPSRNHIGENCGRGRSCVAKAGVASWYGPGFHGHRTANGEIFNQNAMTAASRKICFNAQVLVTYKGKSIVVRINDAGPFVAGRVIDLSKAAAQALGVSTGQVGLQIVSCG